MKARRTETRSQTTILIADDNPDFRSTAHRALRRAGYHVRTAVDGEEAFRILRRESIDVLILDLVMPGWNGIQLLDKIAEFRMAVPIIVVTGACDLATSVDLMERSRLVASFLMKPIDPPHLCASVRWTLSDAMTRHRDTMFASARSN